MMTQIEQNEFRLLYGTSREFSKKVLLKNREGNDRYPYADLDQSVFDKAYNMDFFHLWLPEKLGGLDGHIGKLSTMLLNIAEVDASMAVVILTNAMAQEIMIQAGEQEKLEEIYTKCNSVKQALISFPSFMNPVQKKSAVKAVEKKGKLFLTGIAEGMVLGNLAESYIVPARFSDDSKDSYYLVASNHHTIQVGDPVNSLGLHACPSADIDFCETPGVLIGDREEATVYFQKMYRGLIIAGAAIATGIMRGSFNEALKYSQIRNQGGKKIGDWSEVQLLLANMALKVRNSELLIEHASTPHNNSFKFDKISISLPAFEYACEVTSDGIQILGGYGYIKEYNQEKRYRDAQHLQSLFGISYLQKIQYLKKCHKIG